MKRVIIVYSIILLGLFGIFSALDRGSDYIVEKKLWSIRKQQIDIAKDPTVIPDKKFEQVISGYYKIIKKYPDSSLIPGVHIRIGEMYALRKDYEKARKIFNELIQLYPDNRELSAVAVLQIGKTHEMANNWPQAYKIYQTIIRDYPLTNVGLNTPIYIATHYKNQNNFQETMYAYETAMIHYKTMASAHRDTKVGFEAMRYLSNCYLDQNRWMEAIDTWGMILENYSDSEFLTVNDVDVIIKGINRTAAYQLKDYDIAISLYEGIISRNPGHPLKNYLHKVIDAFNQLKEKGIQVSDRK